MSGPRTELMAIGSELLGPWAIDTNGSFLARRLGERGIGVRFRTVVGDAIEDLETAFRTALDRSDLIVATGGLGPTVDDVTREAVASVLGLPLVEDGAIVDEIAARFRRHGLEMAPRNRRQAMVPRGAEVLPNRVGSAPGLLIRHENRQIALLPGVPAEMRRMVDESLLPKLGAPAEHYVYRILKITGLTESEADRRLGDIQRGAGGVGWTILASPGQIEIHLRERVARGKRPVGIERLDREIAETLRMDLFGRDDDTLEQVVGELLSEAAQTVAVAESLSGGLVGRRITSVPGASRYFLGGVVGYGEEAKVRLLGVRRETIAARTAVSPEVALEMASGVRTVLGSDWGLSTTGYAGPEGGGADRPRGTLILGISAAGIAGTVPLRLPGDRATVQQRSSQAALDLLRRALMERHA